MSKRTRPKPTPRHRATMAEIRELQELASSLTIDRDHIRGELNVALGEVREMREQRDRWMRKESEAMHLVSQTRQTLEAERDAARAELEALRAAAAPHPLAPERCPGCEWANTGLLNYGSANDAPLWLCHGCAARRIAAEIDAADRRRVQLAGCQTAAEGGISSAVVAAPDSYGWSPAYQAVLDLRLRFEALVGTLRDIAAGDGSNAPAYAAHALAMVPSPDNPKPPPPLVLDRERFLADTQPVEDCGRQPCTTPGGCSQHRRWEAEAQTAPTAPASPAVQRQPAPIATDIRPAWHTVVGVAELFYAYPRDRRNGAQFAPERRVLEDICAVIGERRNNAVRTRGIPPEADALNDIERLAWDGLNYGDAATPIDRELRHLITSEMLERHEVGLARYGVALTAFNGRRALVDLYQELLDAAAYSACDIVEIYGDRRPDHLWALLEERRGERPVQTFLGLLALIAEVRARIELQPQPAVPVSPTAAGAG